jgi:hypothetical protein
MGATSLLAGLLLAQCRSVTDNVLGRMSVAAKAESCITDCADRANELIRIESQTHTSNVKACKGNPSCLAAEESRHEAAVKQIQDGRKRCQSGCHHQGGGKGR